jgi:hypothetical protein
MATEMATSPETVAIQSLRVPMATHPESRKPAPSLNENSNSDTPA